VCARFFSALLLALCFVAPLFADGGYLMDQSAKDESLRILTELESNLTTLRDSLQKATESATKLDEDLRLSLSRLASTEKLLSEVNRNLEASEANLSAVRMLLNQAQSALNDSERSFQDYQKSELSRLIIAGGAGVLIGATFVAILNFVK